MHLPRGGKGLRRLSFYVAGTSPLHRLHPSIKLVLYGCGFVLAYVVPWPLRWVMTIAVLIGLWLWGVPPSRYRLVLLVSGIATLTVPLLNGLWPQAGDPLILRLWGDFGFHRFGLQTGLAFAGLYSAMAMQTIAVLATTRTWELAEAPTMLGAHHAVGFAMAYGFRYMPEVAAHYLDLMDVWRTRGVNFGQGWPWQRFWLHCRLLAALLILEFSQVRTKSNAVEARGFSLRRRATYFILPPIPRAEKSLMGVAASVTGLVVLARVAMLLAGWEV
jgi:energy-coupling factor transport system permease protein